MRPCRLCACGVRVCMRALVRACVRACVSVASHISAASETIGIKFDTVTASVTRIHHMLIILTLNECDADLNHENNTCSIISETVQGMPITFAVKIVRPKAYRIFSQSDDLNLHSRSQLCLRLEKC